MVFALPYTITKKYKLCGCFTQLISTIYNTDKLSI